MTAYSVLGRRLVRCSFAAAAIVAVAFGSAAPSRADATRTLRMGYILAPDSQLGAGVSAMADELRKRTGGRFVIEQFPNSALGGDVELLKGVQLGTIDLAFVTGAGLPGVLPESGVFNIPFLFRDTAHAYAVFDGAIGEAYLQKFRGKDIVALAWGENGLRHITNAKRPIRDPQDLKGLKIRVPQSDVLLATFKALGAEVASLPFPELYNALKAGQFDGQENPIATIVASKFAQVQTYLTVSGHVYDPAVIVMSVDAFDELAEADRDAFVAAAKAGGKASRKYAAEAQAKGIEELARNGMQVTTDIDRAKFAAAVQGAMPEFEKKFGADAIAAIRNAR